MTNITNLSSAEFAQRMVKVKMSQYLECSVFTIIIWLPQLLTILVLNLEKKSGFMTKTLG